MLLEFPLLKQMNADLALLRTAVSFSPVLQTNATGDAIRPRWCLEDFPMKRLKLSMIRLKGLPVTADDAQVEAFLTGLGLNVHRLMLYKLEDGSRSGSGQFVADSLNEAESIEARFKKEPVFWPGALEPLLIERDAVHIKTSAQPFANFERQDGTPDQYGDLTLQQHKFLEEVKLRYGEYARLAETECSSQTPQGPFCHVIRIRPCEQLPSLARLLSFKGCLLTKKKASLRTAEFKFAQWLFAHLNPDKTHPFPIDGDKTIERKQEEAQRALERLVRLAEVKRCQAVYREVGVHSIHSIADAEGNIVRLIGSRRPHTKVEAIRIIECLKTLPETFQKVKDIEQTRKEYLKNRGFYDFVQHRLESDAKKKKEEADEESDYSDTELNINDDQEEERAEMALEDFELSVPAQAIQVGYMASSDTFNILWKTSTQLFLAFEELTPRLNIRWRRHNVDYQMRNVLKNVSSVMWIETDLGLFPRHPSRPQSPHPPQDLILSSPSPNQYPAAVAHDCLQQPHDVGIRDPTLDRGPTFLDLFIPVDSAPMLSSQEHFQSKRVGALDFTPDQCFSQMTMIRLQFDLKALSPDNIASLLVICKALVELGLLKIRVAKSDSDKIEKKSSNTALAQAVVTPSRPHEKQLPIIYERTSSVTHVGQSFVAPERLGEVDHWVRWKLACLVTQNRIRLCEIDSSVIDIILKYSKAIVFRALERMEATKERLFDFPSRITTALASHPQGVHGEGEFYDIKSNYALVAHITVTPMETRCEGPLPELSNRLLRGFSPLRERFVRISFRSGFSGDSTGGSMRNIGKMAARKRIGKILENGIKVEALEALLGFGVFEFLVSSPSQLRTQKAWMYCPPLTPLSGFNLPISTSGIRQWLGSFDHIRNVAMFSARLGQGLSSTYHCFYVDPSWIKRIPDVERNGYMFSDGCASISPEIAQRAAQSMGLSYTPSALQFRLAGIKGVVSVDPRLEGNVICVRPSMEKFKAPHQLAFEVVTWTRPMPAHLNKQIIQILSALGLPDQKLIDVQTAAFEKIAALTFPGSFKNPDDRRKKIEEIERSWRTKSKPGSLEFRAVRMLKAGFDIHQEPYLKSIITAIGLRSLQEIHSMARIPVTNGRYAIGIMDEFGVLQPGQVYFQSSTEPRPMTTSSSSTILIDANGKEQCPDSRTYVHKGLLCVSRSPCLHPGDARFVEAVDVPELSHLIDVIVFPQLGDRPLPDECSGGDLDGDQYLILWGEAFIPPIRDTPAFKHETSTQAAKGANDDNEVLPNELSDFFVNYIFDDKLSQIADAHTYWADKSELGVFDKRCLRLAEAHGVAVDAPKTGKVVPHMEELCVSSWPDFMNVNKAQVYLSKKVLGVLYRRSSEEYASLAGESAPTQIASSSSSSSSSSVSTSASSSCRFFDSDLVLPGHEAFIQEALLARDQYNDRLATMMKLFRLPDEASAVIGEAVYNFRSERREWESKKEGFQSCSSDLRSRIRSMFFGLSSTSSSFSCTSSSSQDDRPSDEQLLRASAWYTVTYDPQYRTKDTMWSFPWLVEELLCIIKEEATQRKAQGIVSSSPGQSLNITFDAETTAQTLDAREIGEGFEFPEPLHLEFHHLDDIPGPVEGLAAIAEMSTPPAVVD
jgi:RNA-dependent RNA polymerase